MREYSVYIHRNKANGKRYIGITCQRLNKRWRNGHGYAYNLHFSAAIEKYGWSGFEHEIVATGISKERACQMEKDLIAKYKSTDPERGYNQSKGGENTTEGQPRSEASKAKISRALMGHPVSDETRRKMSKRAKERGNGREGKIGKDSPTSGLFRQIDIETGAVVAEYYGIGDVERQTGFSRPPVQRAAKGKLNTAYGYKWEYIPRRELNEFI